MKNALKLGLLAVAVSLSVVACGEKGNKTGVDSAAVDSLAIDSPVVDTTATGVISADSTAKDTLTTQ